MAQVGDLVSSDLELASVQNEICPISQLFYGAEAVIIFFIPYCYGELSDSSMETLLIEVNQKMDDFEAQELRVICITKEAPSTTRHWITDRGFRFDVYTDATLDVTNSMVGSFDLSQYYQATKGVVLGSYFVCMPGVVVIGGDGKVVSRYVAPSPESVQLSIADIFRMAGFK